MEKVLSVVCFLGAVATISLLVSLIVVLVQSDDDEEKKDEGHDFSDICLSQDCIQESSKLLANMNLDANPYVLEN